MKNDLKVHTKPSLDLSVLVSMPFSHRFLTMSSTWTDIIHSSPRPLDSSSWHFLPKIVPNSDFSFLPKTETIMLVSKIITFLTIFMVFDLVIQNTLDSGELWFSSCQSLLYFSSFVPLCSSLSGLIIVYGLFPILNNESK